MAMELHENPGDGQDGDYMGNQGDSFGGAGSGGGGEGDGSTAGLLPSKVTLSSPKPTYLSSVCGAESLKTPDGFDECSEVCRPSRCCHPDLYGCELDDGQRWCNAYEAPCAGVAESWRGSGHAVASSTPETVPGSGGTGKETIKTMANEVMLKCNAAEINPPTPCIEACNPGVCCYVSDSYPPIEQLFEQYYGHNASPFHTTSSCAQNIGFCQQFGSCEHLNHMKDTSGWDDDDVTYELDIANVCKAEYIAQFGALECSNVCQPAHCCFSGEYKCDDVNLGHLDCDNYANCGVLYPGYTPPKTKAELFEMAQHIDTVCSEDSVAKASGRSECQKLCKDQLCCFETGAYGCANDKSKNCLAYVGCETLVSTSKTYIDIENKQTATAATLAVGGADNVDVDEVDEFITALETACSESSLRTLEGIQQCHSKCQTHLCCFTTNVALTANDCSNMHVEACSAYKPCERLVTPVKQKKSPSIIPTLPAPSNGNSKPMALAETISEMCTLPKDLSEITQDWVGNCHAVCASHMCCLVDDSIGSNCRAEVGSQVCDTYSPCEVLINDAGLEKMNAADLDLKFGDVDTVCSTKVEDDEDMYDACEKRCKERSCCFEEEKYSCYHMESPWCDEYESCSFVDYTFPDEEGSTNMDRDDGYYANDDIDNDDDDNDSNDPSQLVKATESVVGHDPNSFVLDDPTTVATLHSFKTLCGTLVALANNRETCKGHCSSFACCFRNENSCYERNRLECAEYYMCEEFYTGEATSTTSSTIATTTTTQQQTFETACNEDFEENREICKNFCSVYECCFRRENSCYDQNTLECDKHYICEEFFWDEPSEAANNSGPGTTGSNSETSLSYNAEAPNFNAFQAGLEAACSLESLKTQQGIEQCFNKCHAHLCCVSSDGIEGFDCSDTQPDQCNSYSACEQLVSQYNLWTPPSTSFDPYAVKIAVNDACALPQSNVAITEEQWLANCHQVCEARMCCLVDSSLGNNCSKFLGEDECGDYSACQVLIGGAERDVDGIDDVCSSDVTSDSGLQLCSDKCNQRACCFEETPHLSCYELEKAWCDEFEACELVGLAFLGNFEEEPENYNKITDVFDFKSLCTTSTVEDNWDICKSHCAEFACCFREENSCYEINKQECDAIDDSELCEEYYPDTDEESDYGKTNTGLEAACSAESLKTMQGIENCFNKCQAHLCCVPSDELEDDLFDCSDTQPDECDSYYVCENLVSQYGLWKPPSTSFDPYAVKVAVNDACALPKDNSPVSNEWVANCHQVCEARMCCLTDSSLGNNCSKFLGEDECSDYSACKVLVGGADRHIDSIEEVCTDGAPPDKCLEKCNQRSCCFESTPAYSCYGMESLWCDEFAACDYVDLTFATR